MNVVPSEAWIVDPSPPVIALDEPGGGLDPPEPPELEPGVPPDESELVTFDLGLITVKYTGTITTIIIKTKATKRRGMMRRRFDFGGVVVVGKMGSPLSLLPSNVSELFMYADSRCELEVKGSELEAM